MAFGAFWIGYISKSFIYYHYPWPASSSSPFSTGGYDVVYTPLLTTSSHEYLSPHPTAITAPNPQGRYCV
jgi:hypothetical protein